MKTNNINYTTISVATLYERYLTYKSNKETNKSVVYTNHDFNQISEKEIVYENHITAITSNWIIPAIEVVVSVPENKNDGCTVNYVYNTGKHFIRSIITYIESGRYKEELTIGEIRDFWQKSLPVIYM